LIRWKHDQTSSDVTFRNRIFDGESGKFIIIYSPSFDLVMTDSSLSLRTDWQRYSLDKLALLLKCLLIIQTLPKAALEEAFEELEEISRFYVDRSSQVTLPVVPASSIKGKLRSVQVRPPIVLEPYPGYLTKR
jgi:hypothetical protein